MHDADGLDVVGFVGAQMLLDLRGIGTGAPVTVDKDRIEPQFQRQFLPEHSKMAGFIHQHRVAR